ncbi:hypothetical protein Tco_0870830, partial [Tanacetum coccineum]
EAIKSRFGGNDESKKMQKYILKQQFEGFSVSNSEGLHKGYVRFQSLLSQLEIHGAGVSTEDANQKFLGSLPSAWSQVSLIIRTKPGDDRLSFDDLYNNLRVFEPNVKGSTVSSSSTQNVAFVSENTSSTNEVSTAYGASSSSSHNPQREGSSSYTDELMYSFFANQSSGLQLDHEDLEQLDEFNLEEIDLKCRRRDAWNTGNNAKDNERRFSKQEEPKALVTLDGDGVDWTSHSEDEKENYALMAYSNSGSDTKQSSQKRKKKELKAKVEKWHNSSKNLNILITSPDECRDKAGLGSSDIEDSPVNDRYAEGMHAVPPPMTGIFYPFLDLSSDFNSCESNSSEETLTSMPELVVNEPKVVSQPKVWSDAPIIEEYESDSDDEHVSLPTKEQETPSFAFVNTVKHAKTPRQTVKVQNTCSQNPKPNKKDYSGLMSKKLGLGYGFTKKACFVCGSFSYLIRDCDFYEKRMAKQAELNKRMCKGTGKGNKPVWNNVQSVNHQNQFVPKAVLTRTGRIPVNTARASSTLTGNKAYLVNIQTLMAELVKGRQVDLLYSLYEVFCEQKNLDDGDVFHRVIWVSESN